MRIRTIVLVLVLLSALTLVGYALWRFFSDSNGDSSPVSGDGSPSAATSTPVIPSVLAQETEDAVAGYWFSVDTGRLSYVTLGGAVKTVSGGLAQENVKASGAVASLEPSVSGKYALVRFAHPDQFSVLSLAGSSWSPLPLNTLAATWQKSSNVVAFLASESDGSSVLKTRDLGTGKDAVVGGLNVRGVTMRWPAVSDEIFFTEDGDSDVVGSLFAFNVKTKRVRFVVEAEHGLAATWAPDTGAGLIFSRIPGLRLTADAGKTLVPIPFPLTLPEKCGLDGATVFCALPASLAEENELPDSYRKREFYTDDTIISWNAETGGIETIFSGEEGTRIDAVNLIRHANRLYFINRYDDRVYSVPF